MSSFFDFSKSISLSLDLAGQSELSGLRPKSSLPVSVVVFKCNDTTLKYLTNFFEQN